MTNKEYIEKNNISFSDAMKMWDNKTSCINDWLNQEYQKHKFKVGDFLKIKGDARYSLFYDKILVVIAVDDYTYVKCIQRNGKFCNYQAKYGINHEYDIAHKLFKDDPEVYILEHENDYEKIF